jgi:hypothetical protein
VYEVTNPSNQRIRRMIAIVPSILIPYAISGLVLGLAETTSYSFILVPRR